MVLDFAHLHGGSKSTRRNHEPDHVQQLSLITHRGVLLSGLPCHGGRASLGEVWRRRMVLGGITCEEAVMTTPPTGTQPNSWQTGTDWSRAQGMDEILNRLE